ncbi:MAG TPA: DUF1850 domain-containing protein [Stellaceae bacterium]
MSLAVAAICLALGARRASLPVDRFTLAWTHSVEKTGWQEDYALRGTALVLTEARIQGTGAGMEPPPDAVLRDGWWHYMPKLPPLPELRLTLSPYTADYRLCWQGRCRPLAQVIGAKRLTGVVVVRPCAAASAR